MKPVKDDKTDSQLYLIEHMLKSNLALEIESIKRFEKHLNANSAIRDLLSKPEFSTICVHYKFKRYELGTFLSKLSELAQKQHTENCRPSMFNILPCIFAEDDFTDPERQPLFNLDVM